MTHRIAPPRGLPTHDVEVHYLREIMTGVTRIMHDIHGLSLETARPITAELLAEWPLKHRSHCAGCSAFQRHTTRPLSTPITLDRLHNMHQDDLVIVDAFIKALQLGLSEGQLTKHITTADTKAMWKAIMTLQACEERAIWY